MEAFEIISMILGTGVLSTIVTHILTKRKYKVEVDKLSTEVHGDTIGNMDKSLEFYEKWVENTNKRLDEVLHNQDKLMKENSSLRDELNTVKEQTTRMSTLLCTNLPCNQRIVDSSVIDCIYLQKNKRLTRKQAKEQSKKKVED